MPDIFLYPGESNPNDIKLRLTTQSDLGPLKRGILITPRFVAPLLQEFTADNLLLNTLAVPFLQSDWPNPFIRIISFDFSSENLSLSTLAVVANPFTQVDWPNPLAGLRVADSSFENILPLLAAGAAATPFLQSDWPLVFSSWKLWPPQSWRPDFLVSNPKPNAQTEWPNPMPPRQPFLESTIGIPPTAPALPAVTRRRRFAKGWSRQ